MNVTDKRIGSTDRTAKEGFALVSAESALPALPLVPGEELVHFENARRVGADCGDPEQTGQ